MRGTVSDAAYDVYLQLCVEDRVRVLRQLPRLLALVAAERRVETQETRERLAWADLMLRGLAQRLSKEEEEEGGDPPGRRLGTVHDVVWLPLLLLRPDAELWNESDEDPGTLPRVLRLLGLGPGTWATEERGHRFYGLPHAAEEPWARAAEPGADLLRAIRALCPGRLRVRRLLQPLGEEGARAAALLARAALGHWEALSPRDRRPCHVQAQVAVLRAFVLGAALLGLHGVVGVGREGARPAVLEALFDAPPGSFNACVWGAHVLRVAPERGLWVSCAH